MPESNKTQWSDTDKALWILENGHYKPSYEYFFVESTDCYYRVPQRPLPPWIKEWPEQLSGSQKKWIEATGISVYVFETEHDLFNVFS